MRSVLVGFCVLIVSLSVRAQVNTHYNLPNYDNRKLHYGFQLALNYSGFKVKQSSHFVNQDTVQSVRGIGSGAFALGFILNYRLSDFFDARFLPTVAFYERTIRYQFKSVEEPIDAIFESSFIELPLLLKYKSYRRKNLRMYMIGGLKPGIEVGARKRERRNDQLRTQSLDLSIDYGFGLDIYYPLFKFSPELRFSLGLSNLFNEDDNIFSNSIDGLSTYTVTLYLLFE